MSISQLSADLIHEVLVRVPDFVTLSAVIRACKRHLDVFEAHPKSIIRAVVKNITGTATVQAVRLSQYYELCSQSPDSSDQPPNESYFSDLDLTVTKGVAISLERYANAVRVLRDFYSLRHKDRTSLTSKLDAAEMLRFDRALYRYWLWLEMLSRCDLVPDTDSDFDGDDDDDDEEYMYKKFAKNLADAIKDIPSDELLEVLNAATFCTETLQWQRNALPHQIGGSPVLENRHPYDNTDPCSMADNFEKGWFLLSSVSYPPWVWIRQAIHEVLLSRKVKEEELETKTSNAIIVHIIGAEDKCTRCQSVGGVDLYGTPNIFLLAGTLPPYDKIELLPGLLKKNFEEWRLIINHLTSVQHPVSQVDIFHEMVDMVPEGGDDGDEEHWSKEGWYCKDCIKDLFRQRFMWWWRQVKEKGGAPIKDDCWYGYNCRTMTHRSAHANKLNHLCTPTRGDAPLKPITQATTNPS